MHVIFGFRDAAAAYMRNNHIRKARVIEGRHQVYALDMSTKWKIVDVYGSAHDPLVIDARRIFELRRTGAPAMQDWSLAA